MLVLITITEAARALKTSTREIRDLISREIIRAINLPTGRQLCRRDDVEVLVSGRRIASAETSTDRVRCPWCSGTLTLDEVRKQLEPRDAAFNAETSTVLDLLLDAEKAREDER